MANAIYPGIAGAPGYAETRFDNPPPSDGTPPANNGGGESSGGNEAPPVDTAPDTGGSGLVSVDGSNGGINVDAVDTDGNDHGLIDVHSDAPGGLIGDSLDGTHVDVINPDSLVDAHVPGVLDATAGDGTVAGLIGDIVDGDGNGVGNLGSVTDTLQGIEIDALHDGNLLEAHAPNLADITVGNGELGDISGLVGDTAADAIGANGITAEVLNGENIAEAHAGNVADVIVGEGTDLGGILGTLGDTAGTSGAGGNADGLTVEVLNGEYVAEAHAPGTLDATVGGAELGNLVGGADLGGVLGGGELLPTGGDLLGDLLHVGSGGDIAGLDLGHTLDGVTG